MKYDHTNNILNDAVYRMTVLFEHGFAASSAFEDDFTVLAARFSEAGLTDAAARCTKLAEYISRSRFAVDEHMAAEFAALWEYIQLCIDRIGYYGIKEKIKDLSLRA